MYNSRSAARTVPKVFTGKQHSYILCQCLEPFVQQTFQYAIVVCISERYFTATFQLEEPSSVSATHSGHLLFSPHALVTTPCLCSSSLAVANLPLWHSFPSIVSSVLLSCLILGFSFLSCTCSIDAHKIETSARVNQSRIMLMTDHKQGLYTYMFTCACLVVNNTS